MSPQTGESSPELSSGPRIDVVESSFLYVCMVTAFSGRAAWQTCVGHGMHLKSFAALVRVPVMGVVALLLAACASTPEGPYRFSEGWRRARVERVVQGADIDKPKFWECTRKTSAQERSERVYALLSYRSMHHRRTRVVPLTDSTSVRPGDVVYTNVSRCEESIARTARVAGG